MRNKIFVIKDFQFDLQRFDADTWDGTATSVPDAVDNVITITTAEQLAALAAAVNDGTDYSGITIKLDADLDLSGYNWTPIGNYNYNYNYNNYNYNKFKGTFDGQGHTISGLTYQTYSHNNYVGLFGLVDTGGTVQNVTLINVNIWGNAERVGGIAGDNHGTIQNCSVSGTINGYINLGGIVGWNHTGSITNCTFSGTVNCNSYNAGGIAGYSYDGSIKDCVTNAQVSGGESPVGGVVGSVVKGYAGTDTNPNYYSGNLNPIGKISDTTDVVNKSLYQITMPDGVTVDGAINLGGTYYVKEGGTLTISGFSTGEISFGDKVASFTQSSNTFTAKDSAGNELFTVSTTAAVSENSWTVNGGSATYSQGFTTAGAIMNGDKLKYQDVASDSFTINGIKDGTTTEQLETAIDISVDKKVTVKDASVLSGSVSLNNSNYTLDFAESLKCREYSVGFNDMGGGVYKYFNTEGGRSGWKETNGTWTFQTATEPEPAAVLTLSGLAKAPTVNDGVITLGEDNFTGNAITATGNITDFKYAFTVSGKTFNGVKTISGLTYNAAGYYEIADAQDLKDLATYVNAGNNCAGLTFKLTEDISGVDFHIGTFSGTLDGDSHKITVSYDVTTNNRALFNYVDGATIQKLTVDGTINTSAAYAAGLVAKVIGGVTYITDCISSVTINSTFNGYAGHGGFVAYVNSGTLNFTNCIFNGSLLGKDTNNCGGFVGYSDGTVNITNSLFAPTEVTIGTNNSSTFARGNTPNLSGGGYYLQTFGNNQGTQVYKITLPDGATSDDAVNLGGTYYAKEGGTVTISDFNGGEISFGSEVASLTKDGNNFTAKDSAGNTLFTVNTTAAVATGGWEISGNNATYSQGFSAGAIIDGAKLSYQAAKTDSFTISGIKDDTTTEKLQAAIDISADKKVTVNDDSVLSGNVSLNNSNYTLDFADNLKYFEVVKGFKDMGGGVYKYFDASGNCAGWENNNGTWTFQNGTDPEPKAVLTLSGLAKAPTVSDGIITLGAEDFSGDEITADDNNSNFKYAFTVSGKTFNGVKTISGLTYNAADGGYYEISSIDDLQTLATYVNAGNKCEGLTFKVTATIDLSEITNFTPIGNFSNRFKGTFDGQGNTISGLTISGLTSNGDWEVGLFDYVDTGGTVKDVTLINVNVTGDEKVGAVVGVNYGTVTGCKVSGSVNGTSSESTYIGGVVGVNYGTVTGCFTDVNITVGMGGSFGAIVGKNDTVPGANVTLGTAEKPNYYSYGEPIGANYVSGGVNKLLYEITLPNGATADGAVNLGDKYYAKEGGTVTISDFSAGKILFGDKVASFAQSGNNFTAKDAYGNDLFTVNTTAAVIENSWTVNAGSATYSKGFTTAGAIVDGAKLSYQAAENNSFTINGIASGKTADDLRGAISVSEDNKVTVNNASVLSDNDVYLQEGSNYTLDFADNLKYFEVVKGFKDMGGGVYKYFDTEGGRAGWENNNSTWTYHDATEPETVLTLNGLAKAPTVSDGVITLGAEDFSGDEITADDNNSNFKYAFTVSGKTFNGVPTISGLTYNAAGGYYEIADAQDLNDLATYVNAGNNCDGLTFKLTADISGVDFHIGDTEDHKFKGTFDGDDHKITVSYTETAIDDKHPCALFNFVDGATIKKLAVDGNITTSAKYAAGLVAKVIGGVTYITDCTSSVTINSSVGGDGTHGGFVGGNSGTLNFTNCIFDGSLLGSSTDSCAGFVGYSGDGTVNITNSLFAPTEVTIGTYRSATFARSSSGDYSGSGDSYSGGYYTKAFGATQSGTQVYKITLPAGATSDDAVNLGGTYYVKEGGTLTISDFRSGEISFGSEVASLTQSGNNFTAKDSAGNVLFTVSTTAAVGDSSWSVSGTEATYSQGFTTAGAIIDGAKLKYQAVAIDDSLTINGIASGTTTEQLNAAISVSDDKKVTVNNASVLSGSVSLNNSNYTLDFADNLKYREVVEGFNDMGGGVYKYFDASGNLAGWKETNGTWNYQNATEPTAVLTLSGLANAPTVSDGVITLDESDFSGDEITATGTLTNFKYAFTVSGKTFNGVKTISGLTYNAADGGYYEISSVDDLRTLATYVNDGNNCDGLTFKLTADISGVDFHIGTFSGTFDGNNHKITVNYGTETARITTEGCALFNKLDNATVRGLTVDGTIYTSDKYAAGLAVHTENAVTIENCRSSVTINSTQSGDGTHSGFVGGVNSGTLNFTNCIFDGSLLGKDTNSCGGFVGYNGGGTVNITNSLFAPTEVTIGTTGSATFARGNAPTIDGGYYTKLFNDAQSGTQVYKITLPSGVTATGDTVVTFGNDIYAAGTVTISDFSSGEISFGSEVASLTKSGDTFTAKDADGNDLFTVNTTAAVGDSSWTTVNEGSATYNQSFTTAGAIINGAKLSYRAAENDSFTINGIASGTTTNQLNAAISVSDNKQVTVNDDSVLSGGTVSLNNSNYTLDFDRSLKYFEVVKGFNDMGGGVYKYFNESGNFTGWKETAGTWNYQTGTEPTAVLTLSGLANAPTVSDGVITLGESDFSGDAITAEGTLSNFKYAFTVTGKTFAGVPTINGLTYNAADGGYYEIADAQDLADLATYVNSGVNSGHNCEGLTFKVTAAIIDLSAITNFTPIGSDYDNRFNGTFDGQGNTISNLTSSNYNSFCGGLFGWVQKGCRIQNVTLTNVNVTGRDEIGGLVGKNYGSITNCTLSGTVSGTSLVGGLVGSNNHPSGTIENCTFSGTVSGTSLVGGLVGSNESTSGSITNCTFSGTVSGNQYVGGAVGHVKNSGGSVKNTTVDVQVTGTGDNIGAVIGCDNTYKSSDNKYHSNVEQGGTGSTRYFALDLPEGSTYPTDKITVNGKTYYVNGSTVTIDGNDYTIDGDNYYYVDENGKTKLTTATVLTSNATELDGGWYIVKGNVTIDEQLAFDGDTHLILADGATLTVNGEDDGINVNGTLNIYGQTLGTGNLDATGNYNGIVAANNGNINIYGGKIKATGNEGTGISAENAVNISGGQVTATGDHNGIYAGGAINLSWTKSTDFIDASSYSKTPAFAEGKRFYDESGNINPTSGKIYALDGYIITIPDGVNLDSGYIKRSGETNSYICAANAELTLSTGTNAAFEKITGIKDARADGNAYKYTVTEDKTLEPVGFLKIDGLTFVDGNSGEEYYEIADAQDIKDLAAYVSGGNDCTGYTFKLTADLDLTTETFTAISGFKGTFDGNGKLIVTDKAIFSGNTGTITDGYYYGTSIGAFTQTFKVNVPSTVTVTADDDDKTTFGGKTYYKKGAQVTIDGNDFTINADNYYYVDSDGKTKLTTATILDGTQTTLGGGNYIVLGNVTINYTLNISGNANLILADGAKLTVNVEGGDGINVNGTLNIYVQTLGTGNLDATGNYNGIVAANNGNINIYGGKIKATGNEGTGINAYNDVNISGGQVTANGTLDCINANNDVNISGGQVTANGTEGIYANYGAINLSWTKSTDFIDASSYSKTPTFAEGKRFYDQNGNIYDASGTPSGKISALDGYIVEIQEGITITSDNATRIGTTNKYICAAGEVLTLSTGTNAAFEKITGIKNATADGNAYTYTVTGDSTLEPVGFSIITGLTFDYDGEYYKISSLADLQALANYVNAGNNCAGLTFKLTADISGVNFHIGTFSGTFDGNNHKITVNYGTETARIANEGCALFNGLNNATVRGLTVDGTIYTSNKYAAGLVVNSNNTVNIENCRSSVIINSTCGGDGSHSGFVGAVVSGTTNITDCIFDGEFIGADTHSWGGFIGWKGTNANITNCLFNPNYLYVYAKTSAAFSRNGANISNSYYTTDLNDNTNYTNQGTKIYRLTIPDDLTASGNFVEFGGNKYAVENTQVTLTVNNDNSFHKVTGISGATFDGENYTCTVGTSDVEFKLEGFPKIDGLTFNSEGDYYEIGTTDALNALATYVNGGHDCAGLTFKQTADIDLTGKDFTAISDFKGTFDGDGKLITTSSAIFSGDTGTISGGYYYGTSGNGFTQVYKINLPSDVEVDGAISFGGQKYIASGSIVTIDGNDFTINADKYYYVDSDGKTKLTTATILDGTKPTLAGGTYIVLGDVTINQQLEFTSDATLILTDGATLTIKSDDGDGIYSYGYGSTLNIYGQVKGTGKLDVIGTDIGIRANNGDLNIYGGQVTATGTYNGIYAYTDLNIYGGQVTATSTDSEGIFAGNVNISGGQVTAMSTDSDSDGIHADSGSINLSWTKATDFIDASSYYGNVTFKKRFYDESGNVNTTNGKISALDGYIVTVPDGVTITGGTATRIGNTDKYICAANAELTLSTGTNANFAKITGIKDATKDGDTYTYTVNGDATLELDGLPKIDGLTFNESGEYYEIGTTDALNALARYVNDDNHDCAGLTFKLTNDLDLTGGTFTAIEGFNGTFDGNGHLITTSSAIFSGDTGTISGGYYYGTSGNGFTQVYKINLPSDVEVDGAISFGGQKYIASGSIVTIDGNDFTINADKYYYVDSDGKTKLTTATILDGTKPTLAGGTYIVLGDVTINRQLKFTSDATLILADGATLTINSDGDCIFLDGALNIYGQSAGTGNLNVTSTSDTGINVNNINIYGGQVTTTTSTDGFDGIYATNDVNIYGGQVTATGNAKGIRAGNSINLSWTKATDFIDASSYSKTPTFNKRFYDASGNINTTNGKISALDGYIITIPDGVTITGGTATRIGTTNKYICAANAELTLSAKTGYVVNNSITINEDKTITASLDTSDGKHYAFDNGNGYTLATAENTTTYPDLTQVYEVKLPDGVNIYNGIHAEDNGKTYAFGNVTFSGVKSGYVINSANITGNTTISATLDTSDGKHYVFGNATDGYTLATAENTTTYPDLTQVYEVKLPDGVNIYNGIHAEDNGKTYAAGNITFSSETDIAGLERGDGDNYTVNIDSDVAFEFSSAVLTTLTLTDADASAMTLAADIGTVDGTARTKAIKIIGNELDNSILGGSGNDTLYGISGNDILNGGKGNDYLYGGDGADTFVYEHTTIQSITYNASGSVAKTLYSAGSDVIYDYGDGDKISLASGVELKNAYKTNNDVIINVDSGTITVKDSADKAISIMQDGEEITFIDGVFNRPDTSILPATYADEVTLASATKNIDAGLRTSATKITGNALSNSIWGGKGADTLDGAAGDDTLTGNAGADLFVYNGGKDVITDYDAKDKISMAAYENYSTSGDDITFNFTGGGSLEIKGGASKAININGVAGKYEADGVYNSARTSVKLNSDVASYMADSTIGTIDGSAVTNAIEIIGNDKSNVIKAGKDDSTLNGGLGSDYLYGGAGSDVFVYDRYKQESVTKKINADDTITETPKTIYSAGSDVIYNYGADDVISLGSASSVLKNGYKQNDDTIIKVDDGTITIKDTDTVKIVQNGEETVFSGGLFHKSDGTIAIPATFANEYTLANDIKNVDADMRTAAIKITGNALDNKLIGSAKNDTLDGGADDDELTGGAGNDVFVYGSGNDTITDYGTGTDKVLLDGVSNYTASTVDNDIIWTFDENNSLTFKGAEGKTISKVSASTFKPSKTKTGETLAADFVGSYSAASLKVTINGSLVEGTLEVVGNDKANKIYAGKNGSTLNGGQGNDTLYGGDGADIFVYDNYPQETVTAKVEADNTITRTPKTLYGSGSDVILNYGTGDIISLSSASSIIKNGYKQNGDAIIKVDDGTITVKNASEVKFMQSDTEITFKDDIFIKGTNTVILPSTFANEYTLDDLYNVDATNRTAATKLTGNDKANSIVGGKGADTLNGKAGDDTLTGGAGNDLFVYSGGKDIIADYGVGSDKISLTSDYQNYAISGNDIIFNFGGENSLTIKDGKDKAININGVASKYEADGVYNSARTSVKLKASIATYTAADSTIATINGSTCAGTVKILGNDKANKIYAGANGSTLNGYKGNDYLYGGAGADIFVYEHAEQTTTAYNKDGAYQKTIRGTGSDVIYNYDDGDKISLGSDVVLKNAYMNNADAVIKVDDGAITVKGKSSVTVAQDDAEIIFSNGIFHDAENKSVTLPATFSNEFALGNYENVNAALRTSAIKLTGNDSANSIIGGTKNDTLYGNAGDDSLWGGKGTDYLYGGDGNDVFIYKANEGTDYIMDYASGDMLKILDGTFSKATFSSETLNLTVDGGGKVVMKNVTASTEFNINGEIYHVSKKTLAK